MDFGIDCHQPDDWRLEDMLLPGSKISWEARDRPAWERTVIHRNGDKAPLGLRFGNLLDLQGGVHSCPQHLIDTWLEGVDEYGLVMMMASRLVGS